jgi:hypothetical protein
VVQDVFVYVSAHKWVLIIAAASLTALLGFIMGIVLVIWTMTWVATVPARACAFVRKWALTWAWWLTVLCMGFYLSKNVA